MAESDDAEIGRIVKPFLGRNEEPADRSDCPEEEILADYLNGSLTGAQKLKVQQHLSSCAVCVDELVSSHKAVRDQSEEEVPLALIDHARALVADAGLAGPLLDLSVRLEESAIDLVSTTGCRVDALGAEPIAMRGAPRTERGVLQIETEMGEFNIAVHVEHAQRSACEVVVSIKNASGVPAEGVRVGLFSDGRERASYLTQEGRVVFDRVTCGNYTLPIRDAGALVGTVRLDVA